jgi:hypothetical protein
VFGEPAERGVEAAPRDRIRLDEQEPVRPEEVVEVGPDAVAGVLPGVTEVGVDREQRALRRDAGERGGDGRGMDGPDRRPRGGVDLVLVMRPKVRSLSDDSRRADLAPSPAASGSIPSDGDCRRCRQLQTICT